MRKENVFPTRRSVVPTLSVNKTCVYLNTDFGTTFYNTIKNKNLYATYQKKGKKFYLIVSKKKINGLFSFHIANKANSRVCPSIYHFEELKSSDIARYECILVKSDLKHIDVYELKPYAFDSVKSLELFNFKILK